MLSFPFGGRHLDFSCRASRRERVRVVERPGRWMAPAEKEEIG